MTRSWWLAGLVAACAAGAAVAADTAHIARASGPVWVVDAQGARRDISAAPHAVRPLEAIHTGAGGRAVVQLPRSSFVLAENSSLSIKAEGWFRQLAGKAYFAFQRLAGTDQPEYRVETTVATIGVRGTQFLVTVDGQPSVAVEQGAVRVDAAEGEFALARVKELSEFERFVREQQHAAAEQQKDFERYKAQVQTEFVAYVKGVDLGAQQMLALVGREATIGPLSASVADDIRGLRDFAAAGGIALP